MAAKLAHEAAGGRNSLPSVRAADASVEVSDAHLLFTADYSRVGDDLFLIGKDGNSLLIQDYYALDAPPMLVSPDGALMPPELVSALLGPRAPAQYAQVTTPEVAAPIGQVEEVTGSAQVVRAGATFQLNVGDPVFLDDVVQTGNGSALIISFIDETVFSFGANGRMVLNTLIYDPGGTANAMLVSLVQGTFTFISGEVAKTGDMKVQTPSVTVGVRGTTVHITVDAIDGRATVSLSNGSVEFFDPQSGRQVGDALATDTNYVFPEPGLPPVETPKPFPQIEQENREASQVRQVQSSVRQRIQEEGEEPQAEPGEEQRGEIEGAEQVAAVVEGGDAAAAAEVAEVGDAEASDEGALTTEGGEAESTDESGVLETAVGPGSLGSGGDFEATNEGSVIEQSSRESVADRVASTSTVTSGSADGGPTITAQVEVTPEPDPIEPDTALDLNNPPVAQLDAVTTDEDTAVNGNVLADNGAGTDSDPEGNTLTVSAVNGNAANVGTQVTLASGALLTLNANGTFTYDPNGQFESLAVGQNAQDSFAYTVSDGNGGTDTATATLTITGVNDAPAAAPDQATTDSTTPITIDVLSSDSDLDGDALSVTAVTQGASGGAVTINANGTVTFTPVAGFVGEDSFTYTVSDGVATDAASVTVTVNVSNAPQIVVGTSGPDNVTTGAGNDTITTGAGDDVIESGSGDDIINAGDGDDEISAGPGDDTINAGPGDNLIDGGPGADVAVFDGNFAEFNIQLLANGDIQVGDATDTVRDIEILRFNDRDVSTAPPTVSIDDIAIAEEGATSASFVISLSGPTFEDVAVDWVLSDVSATLGADYTGPASGTAIILAGDTVASGGTLPGPFQAIDDAEFEGTETFQVTLGAVSGGDAIVGDGVGQGTIEDNEADVTFDIMVMSDGVSNDTPTQQATISEEDAGDNAATFQITLGGDPLSGSNTASVTLVLDPVTAPQVLLFGGVNFAGTGAGQGTGGGSRGDRDGDLVRVDQLTGELDVVGSMGIKRVSAMDFDPETGTLFATGRPLDSSGSVTTAHLFTVDTATGATSEIGPLNAVNPDRGGLLANNVAGMSVRSDGDLFVRATNFSFQTVDTETGAATFLGNNTGSSGNALAFDASGTLLHAGSDAIRDDPVLESVNQTTGNVTTICDLDFTSPFFDANDPNVGPRIGAMDTHPITGEIFASVITGFASSADPQTSFLAILDLSSTTCTFDYLGPNNAKLDALAFIDISGEELTQAAIDAIQAGSVAAGVGFVDNGDDTVTLTWDASSGTTLDVVLTALDDELADSPEDLVLSLSGATVDNGTAALVGGKESATATIVDNDAAVTFDIMVMSDGVANDTPTQQATISEEDAGDNAATFQITLSGGPLSGSNTASVTLAAGGTASGGTDYDPALFDALAGAAADAEGITFDEATGKLTFTSDAAFDAAGTARFSFTVTALDDAEFEDPAETIQVTLSNAAIDSGSAAIVGPATATVTITDVDLLAAPAAPLITGVADDTGTPGDGITSDNDLLVSGTAEAGATVEVFLDNVSRGTATADGAGNWSFQTGTIADGTHSLTATATDSAGNVSDTSPAFDITIDAVNDAPVLVANSLAIAEGQTIGFAPGRLGATDPDGDDAVLVFTVSNVTNGQFELSTNAGAAVTSFTQQNLNDEQVRFVHDGGENPPSYDVSVSDGVNTTAPASAQITFFPLNDDPVAVDDVAQTNEDTSVNIRVLDNDSDPEGDRLSVAGVAQPANGTVTINTDGSLTYTPDADFNGADNFIYTLSDNQGGGANAEVRVTVNPVNDPPVVDLNGDANGIGVTRDFTEGGGPVFLAPGGIVFDVDGGTLASLTVTLTSRPDGADEGLTVDTTGTNVTVTGNGTGALELSGGLSVAEYQTVLRTVTYNNTSATPNTVAREIEVVANDGDPNNGESAAATATVNIGAINSPPVVDSKQITVDEDSQDNALGLAAPSDVENDPLTIRVVSLPDPAKGTVTLAENLGFLGAELRAVFFFPDTSTQFSNVETFTVADPGVELAAFPDTASVVALDFSDTNLTLTTIRAGTGGAVAFNGFVVDDFLSVLPDITGVSINPATNISGIDSGLSFTSDSFTLNFSGLSFDADQVVSLDFTFAGGSSLETGQTLSLDQLLGLQYDAAADANGPAGQFVYSVFDGTDTVNGTVDLDITPINDAPAIDLNGLDGAVFAEGDLTGAVVDANLTIADPDNTNLTRATATIVAGPGNAGLEFLDADVGTTGLTKSYNAVTGVLTLTGAATLTQYEQVLRSVVYRNTSDDPTLGGTRTQRNISFAVNDGAAASLAALATVNVAAVNDAPVNVVPGPQSKGTAGDLTFSDANGNAISVDDPDAGANDLRVTLSVGDGLLTLSQTAGLTSVIGNGTGLVEITGTLADINAALAAGVTYASNAGFVGEDTLTVTANDQGATGAGGALGDTDTITITVGDRTGDVVLQGTQLTVGDTADGTFTLAGGDTLTLADVTLGNAAGAAGTLNVTGAGTALNVTLNTSLIVGASGTGFLTISGGAATTVGTPGSDASMIIGDQPSGNGTVTVTGRDIATGTPSTLSVIGSGGLIVGNQGTGALRIDGGALTEVTTNLFNNVEIGLGSGGNGTVVVTGAESTLRTIGDDNTVKLAQGVGSTASLTVETGGTVRTAQLEVGRHGMGTATVDGGTIVVSMDDGRFTFPGEENVAGFVRIGRFPDGEGILNVINGGVLTVRPDLAGETFGPGIAITREVGSKGTLFVSGNGSAVNIVQDGPAGTNPNLRGGPFISMGQNGGEGKLTVEQSGQVNLTGESSRVVIGSGGGTHTAAVRSGGQLNIDGTTASGSLIVSDTAQGSLEISGGGQVNVTSNAFDNVEIGLGNGGNGSVVVTGAGSTLRTLGDDNTVKLAQGVGSTASLTVETGGTVRTAQLEVGRHGKGTATVDGGTIVVSRDDGKSNFAGFENDAGFVRIGRFGDGEGILKVINGGLFQVRPDVAGETSGPGVALGRELGSRGTLIVDGLGSRAEIVQTTQELDAGNDGRANGASLSVGSNVGHGRLEVINQGTANLTGFSEFSFTVGQNALSSGSVLVDGAGSGLNLRADNAKPVVAGLTFDNPFVAIGNRGFGEMTVSDGGTFNASAVASLTLDIGSRQTATGSLNVTGAGSSVALVTTAAPNGLDTFGPSLNVGNEGDGRLTIEDEGQVSLTGKEGNLDVSFRPGSTGLLEIDTGGKLIVDGDGTAAFVTIATQDNTNGRVVVDGSNDAAGTRSEILLSSGPTGAQASFLSVGLRGTGSLDILGGARVHIDGESGNFPGIQIGGDAFSGVFAGDGASTVSGMGSELSIAGDGGIVQVGDGGEGTLTVTEGGKALGMAFLTIGQATGSDGTVVVDGSNDPAGARSELLLTGTDSAGNGAFMHVGRGGTGHLDIGGGARLGISGGPASAERGFNVGSSLNGPFGGAGTVIVDGVGSLLEIVGNNAFIGIGRQDGTGTVTVRDGGSLTTSGQGAALQVGRESGANGTLEVLSGGTVTLDGGNQFVGLIVSRLAGSQGSVLVSGQGSAISIQSTATTRIDVGGADTGSMTVADGGSVTGAQFLFVGRETAATGALTVRGTESRVQVNETAHFGTSFDDFTFDPIAGGTGTGLITDGGRLESGVAVLVGNGTLDVTNGGQVASLFMSVERFGGNATARIMGQGSHVDLSGTDANGDGAFLGVGPDGVGRLEVTGGAEVLIDGEVGNSPGFQAGRNAGSEGTIVVDGAGSNITVQSELNDNSAGYIAIGRSGTGHLEITNGGTVTNEATGVTFIGGDAPTTPGTGTVLVRGGATNASTLNAGAFLLIGRDFNFDTGTPLDTGGTGTLTIANGGAVNAGTLSIGAPGTLNAGKGTINLGGTLTNAGTVAFGEGPGTLNINGNYNQTDSELVLKLGRGGANVGVTGSATFAPDTTVKLEQQAGVRFGDAIALTALGGASGIDMINFPLPKLEPDFDVFEQTGGNIIGFTTVFEGFDPDTGPITDANIGTSGIILGNGAISVVGQTVLVVTDIDNTAADPSSLSVGSQPGQVSRAAFNGNVTTGQIFVQGDGTSQATFNQQTFAADLILNEGNAAGAQSFAVVGSPGSLTLSGNAIVGDSGTGQAELFVHGALTVPDLTIGDQANARGFVGVEGGFLNVTGTATLVVGNQGNGELSVSLGGIVNVASDLIIANAAGSEGDVTVKDDGSRLNVTRNLFVANAASTLAAGVPNGTLDIENAGFAQATQIFVGTRDNALGQVTVNGMGSRLVAQSDEIVNIFMSVGNDFDGTGSGGRGEVTVSNGGLLGAPLVDVGRSAAGGLLTVINPGSQVVTSNDFGVTFADQTGDPEVRVGRNAGDDGEIQVLNGGQILIRNSPEAAGLGLQIARNDGSTGRVLVDGAGAERGTTFIDIFTANPLGPGDFGPFLHLGRTGDGTMTIRNTGEVRVTGEGNLVRVSRGNSELTNPQPSDGNVPDRAAQSDLIIESGGRFLVDGLGGASTFNIGLRANANGFARVSGVDAATGQASELSVTGATTEFNVGRDGIGVLEVLDRGIVEIENGTASIGAAAGSQGTVTVRDDGSQLNVGNDLFVANGASTLAAGIPNGTLNVEDSGLVTAASVSVAGLADSVGQVTVDGGRVVVEDEFTMGQQGDGTLIVRNGGSVESKGNFSSVGNGAGSKGEVTVTGDGSTVTYAGTLAVANGFVDTQSGFGQPGAPTSGTLSVEAGGLAQATRVSIGTNDNATGIVTVDGTDSRLIASSAELVSTGITVGASFDGIGGTGQLTVSNGGFVGAALLETGRSGSADNLTIIRGAGSTLRVSNEFGTAFADPAEGGAFLRIAREGGQVGEMRVLEGGQVFVTGAPGQNGAFLQIARNDGSTAKLLIDGQGAAPGTTFIEIFSPNTLAELAATLPAGAEPFGPLAQISRTGDGEVRLVNGGELRLIGDGATANVSQGNSNITNPRPSDGNIPLRAAQSDVFVESGGKLSIDGLGGSATLNIAREANANGFMRVSGAGSEINITGTSAELNVARDGLGTLEIQDGGTVSNDTNGVTTIGREAGSDGTVIVQGTDTTTVSTLNAGAFLLVGMDFDFPANNPLGPGTGGTGRLTINDFGQVNAGQAFIGTDGGVGGTGTLAAATTTLDGGAITAGASAGTLTIDGDLTARSGAFKVELGGTGPTDSDLIAVSGTADLQGVQVEFTLINGYQPQTTDAPIVFLSAAGGVMPLDPAMLSLAIAGVGGTVSPDDFSVGIAGNDLVFTADAPIAAGDRAFFFGSGLDDNYTGGDGDDDLRGGGGDDTFTGGAGNDTIDGGDGTGDRAVFAGSVSAFSIAPGGPGEITVMDLDPTDGDLGTDTLRGVERVVFDDFTGNIQDLLPTTVGTAAADILTGGPGNDRLTGFEGADTLRGLGGNDILDANAGDDTLIGGPGNDDLRADDGNDTLIGGPDNDTLRGSVGDDVFILNLGDGADVLFDTGGVDRIEFGPGIAAGSVTAMRVGPAGRDLLLGYGDQGDRVTLDNFFLAPDPTNFRIEEVRFADGTVLGVDDLIALAKVQAGTDTGETLTGFDDFDDTLSGLGGNDVLDGDAGNDTLNGGTGNDTLRGDAGDDMFVFNLGDGADVLFDTGGLDRIEFGAGIAVGSVTATRVGPAGRDLLLGYGDQGDRVTLDNFFISPDPTNVRIEEVRLADGTVLTPDDLIALAKVQVGTDAGETLTGFDDFDDTLSGLAGNDVLDGNAGNDTLNGGAGNDTLRGDAGDDVFVFNLGDGADVLFDTGGVDRIEFGAGIAAGSVTATRVGPAGRDLLIGYGDQGDRVTLDNFFISPDPTNVRIEEVRLADGTVLTPDDLIALAKVQVGTDAGETLTGFDDFDDTLSGLGGNDTLDGNAGDDTLNGGAGNDTLRGDAGNDVFVLNLGDGADVLFDTGGVDRIEFGAGIAAGSVTAMRVGPVGRDLLLGYGGQGDRVTLDNFFLVPDPTNFRIEEVGFADGTVLSPDDLIALAAVHVGTDAGETLTGFDDFDDTLSGLGGNDVLDGNAGDDTLNGGAGNDTLRGDAGNDVFVLNLGDGADVLFDTGGVDRIEFGAGIAAGSVTAMQVGPVGRDLLLGYGDQGDRVTLDNFFLAPDPTNFRIEEVRLADGTVLGVDDLLALAIVQEDPEVGQTLTGFADTNDRLTGANGDDTLSGLAGNDTLDGNAGNDTLDGGPGNDTLRGDGGNDVFILNLGDGSDTLFDTGGLDRIEFGAGISAGSITASRTGNNLVLGYGDQGDRVQLDNFFLLPDPTNVRVEEFRFADGTVLDIDDLIALAKVQAGTDAGETLRGFNDFDDTLSGLGGNDTLDGNAGNDTLTGGSGNDLLFGDAGNDVFILNLGDGADHVFETGGLDRIEFGAGIASDTLAVSRIGNDLLIGYGDQGDQVRLDNFFLAPDPTNFRVEEFRFADGTVLGIDDLIALGKVQAGTDAGETLRGFDDFDDTLSGLGGNDTLDGNAGNDTLTGGSGNDLLFGDAGNDVFILNLGDGADRIFETGGLDRIEFGAGIASGTLAVSRTGNDLLIGYGDQGDRVTLTSFFLAPDPTNVRVEEFRFADGTVLGIDDLIALGKVQAGTDVGETLRGFDDFDDTLAGLGGNDTLDGNAGNDTLDGGPGNDSLLGDAGNDTYVLNLGDGVDMIFESGGTDVVEFGAGIAAGTLAVSRTGNDLLIGYGDQGDRVQLDNFFLLPDPTNFRVEEFRFADGTVLTPGDLIPLTQVQVGTDGNNVLSGFNDFDDTLSGLGGNDTLDGNAGNDTLDGGPGNDTLRADAGNDTLTGGPGNDTLRADAGNDTLTGGPGNDTLQGGAGADTFVLEPTGDTLSPGDVITDFEDAIDLIEVRGVADIGGLTIGDAGGGRSTVAVFATNEILAVVQVDNGSLLEETDFTFVV